MHVRETLRKHHIVHYKVKKNDDFWSFLKVFEAFMKVFEVFFLNIWIFCNRMSEWFGPNPYPNLMCPNPTPNHTPWP